MSTSPRVVVIAGPNGAGKSTTAPGIVQQAFGIREFINADTLARGLSAFSPETVAVSAGRIMLARMSELAAARASFAFETTLATRSYSPRLAAMQSEGFEIHLVFVWLPTAAMANRRVATRVRLGGHSVPEHIVNRRFERGLRNFFNLYRPMADSWLMLDNSGKPVPRPIAWRNVGGPIHVARPVIWNALRAKYEEDSRN